MKWFIIALACLSLGCPKLVPPPDAPAVEYKYCDGTPVRKGDRVKACTHWDENHRDGQMSVVRNFMRTSDSLVVLWEPKDGTLPNLDNVDPSVNGASFLTLVAREVEIKRDSKIAALKTEVEKLRNRPIPAPGLVATTEVIGIPKKYTHGESPRDQRIDETQKRLDELERRLKETESGKQRKTKRAWDY
jgi:hypothetical protein